MSPIKTKKFKDFKNSWSSKSNKENVKKASEIISKDIKETKLLDWIESKGYGVKFNFGQHFKDGANYDMMGQQGYFYTFYLYELTNRYNIEKYLINEYNLSNTKEVLDEFSDEIIEKVGDGYFRGVEFIPMEFDGNKLIFDENTEIEVDVDTPDETDSLPHWNAMVPINPNDSYRKICEFGLFRAKSELSKLYLMTGVTNFYDLNNKLSSSFSGYNIDSGSSDELVKYMNKSSIYMNKNEDLDKAIDTNYMLYKTSKLIMEIADPSEFFKIPYNLINEFLKLPFTKLG